MKPKRIILVRHGESEGNKDECIYKTVPDYAVRLTPLGEEQATAAGMKIKDIIKEDSVFFYVSPMWRTRMTFKNIVQSFDKNKIRWREEPRIREQEWGHFKTPGECRKIRKDRDRFGPFYYRIPDGESGADVYDRVRIFLVRCIEILKNLIFPRILSL
ncbi:MAG TPA: phosphoglycerate mutase family protein [Bacteroidales bacterium]|jgi:broad specificity phosphatase PhoE|nr:phosphoglycerate mutase family protein [Bacteroidales bacterium]